MNRLEQKYQCNIFDLTNCLNDHSGRGEEIRGGGGVGAVGRRVRVEGVSGGGQEKAGGRLGGEGGFGKSMKSGGRRNTGNSLDNKQDGGRKPNASSNPRHRSSMQKSAKPSFTFRIFFPAIVPPFFSSLAILHTFHPQCISDFLI